MIICKIYIRRSCIVQCRVLGSLIEDYDISWDEFLEPAVRDRKADYSWKSQRNE